MRHKAQEVKSGPGKGFTLIELMLVVAIIGILAAIALPAMEHAMWRARAAKVISDFYVVRDATMKYYVDNGHYPPDMWPGQEIPDLTDDLSNISWTQPWGGSYDWDVWLNAAGQPTQGQTGVAIGFSVVTDDERFLSKLYKLYKGDLRPTLANHHTFVIQSL